MKHDPGIFIIKAFSPLVAELCAIKEGLVMAADMKISNFSIESDCANAVSLLKKSYNGCSNFDGLVDKILESRDTALRGRITHSIRIGAGVRRGVYGVRQVAYPRDVVSRYAGVRRLRCGRGKKCNLQ